MNARGFVMMEILVALLVLALVVTGTLALALGSLATTAEARRAELAASLAGDLAGRLRVLPGVDWTTLPATAACDDDCAPEQLAAQEMADWLALLEATLPDASASLAATAPGQLGLELEWSETGGERRRLRLGMAP